MKRLATAITLLIASAMATAADTQVGNTQSFELARVDEIRAVPLSRIRENAPAMKKMDGDLLRNTLGVVSATLTYELQSRFEADFTALR